MKKKRLTIPPMIISACAASYMLYVFIDLTFLTSPEAAAEQSLADKVFPVVFLVVGLYMLRLAWDQYKDHRDDKTKPETDGSAAEK